MHVQSHSMPTPQQLPDPLQRSISPGGFDSFSLATDFPSLSMLSPHSQHQQQAPSLPRQQLPSYDLASGVPHNALTSPCMHRLALSNHSFLSVPNLVFLSRD